MMEIPQVIKALPARYNYPACWLFLDEKGKALYGPKFHLYPEDGEVVAKLLIWALKDPEGAHRLKIDLGKGIMLAGPIGTGKTTLMNLMRHLLPPPRRYLMRSCREIAFEFATDGYPAISKYGKQSFYPGTEVPAAICFDDLGLEPIVQYYGNTSNTMAEILLSRYDYFISHGMLTHITTNLNSNEIEQRYGTRVRSRMRELFNLFSFNMETKDKRK